MKKLILLIILIVIGFFAYQMIKRDDAIPYQRSQDENGAPVSSSQPNPTNATITFDDGPVSFSSGRFERELDTPGFFEEFAILDKIVYGDLNNDKKDDSAFFVTRYGGGSGTFIYVAGFVSGPVSYRGSNAIFIGDRIIPQDININNGVLRISYLDREADAPFSTEPTVLRFKELIYQGNELVER